MFCFKETFSGHSGVSAASSQSLSVGNDGGAALANGVIGEKFFRAREGRGFKKATTSKFLQIRRLISLRD
jgi:hypothetical protein